MDVHVPYAISFGLRLRKVDVVTSQEDGTTELEDSDLLDRAAALGRVLFTQDTDFLRIARERQRNEIEFAGIIFANQSDVTVSGCVRDLELIAKVYSPEELADRVEYLPL
jgi:predicted nuclease of predicted toxin-antitoxin system